MKGALLEQALRDKLAEHRVVFWHDPKGEFAESVGGEATDALEDVTVLEVARVGGLSVKLRLEQEDPTGRYLVYSQGEQPHASEDWLLDIRLYSGQFHADVASIWMSELGIEGLALRPHFEARAPFLRNQDRRRRLRALLAPGDDEALLDLKMLAVLVGSSVASPSAVLRALCDRHLGDGEFDLRSSPEALGAMEKMGLSDRFWDAMQSEFGYEAEEPTVGALLRRLFVSELVHQLDGVRIEALSQFELSPTGRRNAVVCLSQWRDSNAQAASYEAAAAAVAHELAIRDHLSTLSIDALLGAFTFVDVEQRILGALRDQVLTDQDLVDVEEVAGVSATRRGGHWLSGPGGEGRARGALRDAYLAVEAAAKLFGLRREHDKTLKFESSEALLVAYRNDLFRFDQLYRTFWIRSEAARAEGWDLLKSLGEEVERVYDQDFIKPLGIEWSRLLDAGFLTEWSSEQLPPHRSFYNGNIRPHLGGVDRKRAFVIISDALRYEAASELTETLNGRYRVEARLSAMLGALPSYTALGMASLLPHTSLAYNAKGDVLVDGNGVASTEARSKQLATVQGMACQAKDLRRMKRDEARELTEGCKVVYIYHDVIDSRGDSASSEGGAFQAVADCLQELEELVGFCINKLNAAKVWITSDHGFLYQQDAPAQTDKSKLDYRPPQAVIMKKRYVIGPNLGATPEAHHGDIQITGGASGGMEFWVPRGNNRFHFTGGARFIHGGAMPQEVVVPLVCVTQLRGKQKEGSRVESVSVQVLGTRHTITTPMYRFELIQTEAVTDRRRPITLRAAVYDDGTPVTSVETLVFDSASDSIDERKKSIRLELRTGDYDKAKEYRLLLHDAETDVLVQSQKVVIDRSFDDDF